MPNEFQVAAEQAIKRHGRSLTYRRVTTGAVDLNTGGVSTSDSDTTAVIYKRQIRASQFNFPSLIGKEIAQFYVIAQDLPFTPKVKDKILDGATVYTIDSFQSHEALGTVILYRILGVV